MRALDLLAERKIAEAIERGEFSRLPGEGRPLALDDDAMIPQDMRLAYRVLKNAGYVPPEVEALRGLRELERWLELAADDESRRQAVLKLDLLRAQLEARGMPCSAATLRTYREQVLAKLQRY